MVPRMLPVAIVTGAGSGIGRELAVELSRRNYRVVLAGRRRDALEQTLGMLEGPGLVSPTDVRDPEQCQKLVDRAVGEFSRVDALINNAGYAPCVPITQHTPDLIQEVFAVNALGPAYLTVAAWKVFEKQFGEDEVLPGRGRPCVLNVSSMSTVDPFPGLFAYAAAKGALNVMVKSLANEGRDIGVRAFALCLGSVETAMLRGIVGEDLLPKDRTIHPAEAAAFLADHVTGQHDEHAGKVIIVPSPGAGKGWADEAG
ncbi:MAG TPA: SDR family oxidoreductase [Phycisphaerales bacterium]|nr:SDR family oxidoreductase [Phycisphaerales bacterium]